MTLQTVAANSSTLALVEPFGLRVIRRWLVGREPPELVKLRRQARACVTSTSACQVLLQLVLCLAASAAAANVVEKLQRVGEVSCEPAWPFFCSNFHVACAGQTSVRTFGFTLRAAGAQATLAAGADGAGVAEPYARARVVHDAQNQSVLVLPDSTHGYLKLQADGRYSLRHYQAHQGIMSVGRCE